MFALEKHALVTRYIRSLRGGSQPILAEASDGNMYVVKFMKSLQGPHLLFNEGMGTELYRSCGLPVAPWTVLQVSDRFLDQNPGCWSETVEGRQRPAAGLCFGSRFLDPGGTSLYEVLPGSYFQRVRNARDFWVGWVLDVCADHSDSRQAIFCEEASGHLESVFIDFGHMFGGASGGELNRPFRTSRYRDERIYPHVTSRFLLTLRRILGNLDTDRLWQRLAAIPDDWKSASSIRSLTRCLGRLSDASFVERTANAMVKSHQLSHSDKLAPCRERRLPVSILRPSLQREARHPKFAAY